MATALRTYDTGGGRWRHNPGKTWNGASWIQEGVAGDGSIPFGARRMREAAQGSVITRSVAAMPLATNSAAIAAWVDANKLWTPGGAWGEVTVLNRFAYAIPIYVVDSTHPNCHHATFDIQQGGLSDQMYRILEGSIPCPAWATPAAGGDKALAIYDVGTGIMREYFGGTKTSETAWTANTGGYYIGRPGLHDLASTNPALQLTEGSSAVVKMLNPVGQIGIDEARKGVINHAIQFTSSQCASLNTLTADEVDPLSTNYKTSAYSWPAQMADGTSDDPNAHRQGQWFRLPPDLDPDDPYLNFKPFTRVLIRAAQTYGGFSTDKNLWVHAFNVEPGTEELHHFGVDPWASSGELEVQYGTLSVDDFPWHLTEWAPVDWGKPVAPGPFVSPAHA